jgi:transposase-like protein/very-short-patch-repair endonuclease
MQEVRQSLEAGECRLDGRKRKEYLYRNKEWLYEEYIIKKKSGKEIAREIGCDPSVIYDWLKKLNVPIRKTSEAIRIRYEKELPRRKYTNKKWLYTEYVLKRKSAKQIAKETGVSYGTFLKYLHKYGIKDRGKKYRDRKFLYEEYAMKKKSSNEIAKELGCHPSVITDWLKRLGIPTRKTGESLHLRPLRGVRHFRYNKPKDARLTDREWLYKEYIEKGRSGNEIANELGVHSETIYKWLQRNGIDRRSRSESIKIKWKKGDFFKRWFRSVNIKPNKFEKRIEAIIQKFFSSEFIYNGDLSAGIVIGNKIPDFVHRDKKMVIECFGEPFHTSVFCHNWKDTEFGTVSHYSQFGYKCLILWYEECAKKKDEEIVKIINDFLSPNSSRQRDRSRRLTALQVKDPFWRRSSEK